MNLGFITDLSISADLDSKDPKMIKNEEAGRLSEVCTLS